MGVISGVLCGAVTVGMSVVFPGFFNTTQSVRELATGLLIISAIGMPLQAYIFAAYFTLRAGGKTIVTLIFDSGAIWVLMIPAALICTGFTTLPILVIYAICNAMDIIKCMIGYYFLRRRDWIQNLAIK